MFVYKTNDRNPEETLRAKPIVEFEAKEAFWTVTDMQLDPINEQFMLYSTLSGVIHKFGKTLI